MDNKANIFEGKLVRLATDEPEKLAEIYSLWGRDSHFSRLLDSGVSRQWSKKKWKEWLEKDLENLRSFPFVIKTIEGDRPIGFVGLGEPDWAHGDCYVGIGIGERDYWGKGYGTEAMQLILRYAFTELNLRRVSLSVFEYNPRGIRSYEKAGFKEEGRLRKYLHRDGKRWDILFMGILQEEWLQFNQR
jgi:RimJ/RimL family protein N-acetyltransferase